LKTNEEAAISGSRARAPAIRRRVALHHRWRSGRPPRDQVQYNCCLTVGRDPLRCSPSGRLADPARTVCRESRAILLARVRIELPTWVGTLGELGHHTPSESSELSPFSTHVAVRERALSLSLWRAQEEEEQQQQQQRLEGGPAGPPDAMPARRASPSCPTTPRAPAGSDPTNPPSPARALCRLP